MYVTSITASCYYHLVFCIMLHFTNSMWDLLSIGKLSQSGIMCCIFNLNIISQET